MKGWQDHHTWPKEFQRQMFNYPENDGVIDDRTIRLRTTFHQDITNQTRHQGKYRDLPTGVPLAYTIGEIDMELFEEGRWPGLGDF